MKQIGRLVTLVSLLSLIIGCQTTITPTSIPSTVTPVPPTTTPIPVTDTPVAKPAAVAALPTNAAPVSLVNAIAFFAYNPNNDKSEIKAIQTDGRIGPTIPNTTGAATAGWSPDGKRIAYIVHHGDLDWPMYVVGTDGKNLQRLTQGNLDYSPSWSPDSTQIAFSRNGNLWVMRVSDDPQPVVSDLRQLTTDPKELVWGIAWSPDGTQIAFDSQMGDPKGTASYNNPTTTEIYLINADGSNLRKLTDNHVIDAGPGWSPDGKHIVFFSNRDGDPNYTMKKAFSAKNDGAFQIYSVTADGQNIQRLTNTPANNMQPAWSPDGKQIAFSSNRDGNYEIYVVNADGSEPTRLTESPTQDGSPAWLPALNGAGSNAYLGQTTPGLTPQVFAPGIVSIPSAMDFAGTFSPDGTEFYFTRRMDGSQNVIYETHLVNGDWTDPAPAAFAAGYTAFEPHVTADSNTLYFGWAHALQSEEKSTLEDGGILGDRSNRRRLVGPQTCRRWHVCQFRPERTNLCHSLCRRLSQAEQGHPDQRAFHGLGRYSVWCPSCHCARWKLPGQ